MKMLRGYANVVRSADVSWADKFACFAMLVPWSIRNRPGLWKDFHYAVAHALSSRRKAEDSPSRAG
jgi:hypothetical protein